MNPDSPVPYLPLMFNYIALNRLDEAKAAYKQAFKRKFDSTFYSPAVYQIPFCRKMQRGWRSRQHRR